MNDFGHNEGMRRMKQDFHVSFSGMLGNIGKTAFGIDKAF